MKVKYCSLVSLLGWCLLTAQIQFGSIDVNVSNNEGAPIVGASVTAVRIDNGATRESQTSSNGLCRIEGLPPGEYKVSIQSRGFVGVDFKDVMVTGGQEKELTAKLVPGAEMNTTVEVTVATPVLLTEQQIVNIPLSGRSFLDLSVLTDGSALRGGEKSESATYFTTFLDRYSNERVVVNGTSLSDDFDNRELQPNTPHDFRQDAAVGSNFEAKFSNRNFGAVTSQLVSGTNEWHGSAKAAGSNKLLNARQFFDFKPHKAGDYWGTSAATLGGPLISNKVFVFLGLSYEMRKFGEPILTTVPSQADLATAVANLGGTGLPSSTNPVINAGVRRILLECESKHNCPGSSTLWPTADVADRRFLNTVDDLHNSSGILTGAGRLDVTIDPSLQLAALYSGQHTHQISPTSDIRADGLPTINTKTISESHVAELTLNKQFTPQTFSSGTLSVLDTTAMKMPIDPFSALLGGIPQIVVSGYSAIGPSPFDDGLNRHERTYRAQAEVGLVRDRHNITVGYEFQKLSGEFKDGTNTRGRLLFRNLTDFLAGQPLVGSININPGSRSLSEIYQGAYFQDNFRVKQSFVLNAGLRWEFRGAPKSSDPFFLYNPAAGLQPVKRLYASDFNDFAPRIGGSYKLKEWILRAGGALFYQSIPLAAVVGQIQNDSFHPGVAFNSPSFSSLPVVSMLPIMPTSFFNPQSIQASHGDLWSIDQLRTPYNINFTATVQPPTGRKLALLIGYAGLLARKLPRVVDANAPSLPTLNRPFANSAGISPAQPLSPFVVNKLENSSNSSFHSLQVLATLSEIDGFSGTLQWFWSHAIDDASDFRDSVPNSAFPDTGQKSRTERVSSSFDIRHFLSFTGRYNTADRFDHPFFRNITITANGSFGTGNPFSPTFGDETDPFGERDFVFRPDFNGGARAVHFDPLRRIQLTSFSFPCLLLNPALVQDGCAPSSSHIGSLPRNFFSGPSSFLLSASVARHWKITERLTSTIAVDGFNVLNHARFSIPTSSALTDKLGFRIFNGGLSSVSCGTSSPDCFLANWSAGAGRSINISAKLTF